MTVGQPLQDIALVDLPSQQSASDSQARQSSGPQHCVLLRAGGLLSLLDIELGMNMCPLSAYLAYLVPIKTLCPNNDEDVPGDAVLIIGTAAAGKTSYTCKLGASRSHL